MLLAAACAPQPRPQAEQVLTAPAGTWIAPGSATNARLLLAAIDRSAEHGLDPGLLLPPADRQTIEQGLGATATPVARHRAERLLTAAFANWLRALETPALSDLDVVVPEALPAPTDPAELLQVAARSGNLAATLHSLDQRHPFHEALRTALVAERSGQRRAQHEQLLLADLERTRALPVAGRHIVVDLASQRLWMFDGRVLQGRMRVVVGAADTPTPTMISLVEAAVARPYWNVPEDLAQTRIARQVLRDGPRHLDRQHLKLLSGWTDDAVVIPPEGIDWKAAAARQLSIRVRQDPGPWNMMGRMKFLIRNDLGIYLHDTPERGLFRRSNRAFSAGCIRVEDWRRMAEWLFEGAQPSEDGTAEQLHALPRPVPIHIVRLAIDPLAKVEQPHNQAGNRRAAAP